MPGPDGKLTSKEIQDLITQLNALGEKAVGSCPICGETDWTILPDLVQPVTLGAGGMQLGGGPGYPMVMLISPKCGYTRFINAVVAGIVPSDSSEKKQD